MEWFQKGCHFVLCPGLDITHLHWSAPEHGESGYVKRFGGEDDSDESDFAPSSIGEPIRPSGLPVDSIASTHIKGLKGLKKVSLLNFIHGIRGMHC